jgi:hypothetical protein
MMYELRIYHCVPGKLPELHKRFEGVTLKLFAKHGIRPVGFWTVRAALERLHRRSRVDREARRERKERAAARLDRLELPRADRLFGDEIG